MSFNPTRRLPHLRGQIYKQTLFKLALESPRWDMNVLLIRYRQHRKEEGYYYRFRAPNHLDWAKFHVPPRISGKDLKLEEVACGGWRPSLPLEYILKLEAQHRDVFGDFKTLPPGYQINITWLSVSARSGEDEHYIVDAAPGWVFTADLISPVAPYLADPVIYQVDEVPNTVNASLKWPSGARPLSSE